MRQKLMKIGLACGGAGLLGIAVVLVSGTAYPEPLFRALAPLSLLLICAAVPPLAAAWLLNIRREWKSENHLTALLWVGGGGLLVLLQLCRLF